MMSIYSEISADKANAHVRNSLELTWRIHKVLPDPVGELDGCNEITNTEAKAHRDINAV
jgi:hypothetical protein